MTARTLPTHDRRLTDPEPIATGPLRVAAFVAQDGRGVSVSVEPQPPAGAASPLSVTRPNRPPTADDLAVVRIAVCGPGSQARSVPPEDTELAGRIIHLWEEPDAYEPPDAPWWTRDAFEVFAVATLEGRGRVRVAQRQDPERGDVVQLDLRALFWRKERRRQRATRGG